MFGAFNMIKQKITDVINLNFKYSDSLANVRKVTNWSMKDVEELSNSLSKMDTRTSLEGLTQLAYIGSRMGMGKYGVQGLADFAKASDRVNVALKEDLGDDAMLTLSKFVETMGEVEKHGGNISEAFDSVSSSIFKLASTSTANGGNILEFAKRLTGLSKSAHITSDQLLGLASASDSLMLMPEVASTAFGKLISSLWTNYHDIEKMLGMQEDSLKDMMSKGQTMQALVKVLENVSDKNLSSMDEYFKEFGSDGQRLKSVVVTMAQNIGVLKSHLKESSEAYREGTAVTKEYEIQQQTAQAILERANNMWEKAFVNPDGIDAVKEMAKVWYNFSKELTQSKPFLTSVQILFWEFKKSVEALLFVLPGLLAYLGTRGLVMAFSKLIPLMIGIKGSSIVGFFTLLTQAIKGSHFATLRLIVSWKQLSLAMKTNIIGLVISVVTSLGVAIHDLVKKTNEASSSVQKFNSSFKGVREAANHAVAELDAYYGAIKRAKKGSNEYQAAMKTYVDKFGIYFKKLKNENGMVQNLAESYRQAAKAIRGKIYLQMQEDDIQKHYKPRIGWSLDKLDAYGKVAPKGFGTDVLKGYEEDNRNKNMGTIIADLARRYGSKNVARVLASEKEGRSSAQVRKVYKDTLGDGTVHQYVKYVDLPIADQRLFSALRYIRQARSANNVFADIKNKFAGAQDEISDYLKAIDAAANEDLGGGGGGKGNSGGGGKNTPKTDNTAKQEEQKAKTRTNALIANIKAFYEEQKRKYLEWVTQMNADGEKVSEGQQQQMLALLDAKTKTALGTARKSIATMSDDFKKFFSHMDEDVLIYDDEISKSLLESIGKSDISELHALFQKLSGDLSRENNQTLSENLGALLDQIFANGSQELREAAEKLLAQQREIQKILNEHDYTGAVDRSTRSNFDKIGFLRPASGVDAATEEGLQKMNDAFDNLTAKARSTIVELYQLNPESEDFQSKFMDFLSVANNGFDFTKLTAQQLKALYIELIKYNDEYDAASKRRDDERKKLIDYSWSQTAVDKEYQQRLPGMQQEVAVTGNYRNAAQSMGMQSVSATDPELEMMKMRMEYAETYYAFLEEHQATEQQLADARKNIMSEQASYAQKLTSDMFSQYNSLLTFMGPLQTFGESVGDAFATMTENASEGRKALRTALKQMVKQFATSSLQMISQQQIDRAQTTAHYTELLLMQQAFGTAKVSAEISTGTAIIGAQQATHLSEEELEGVHQQVMASLRSAGIFGWCVSTLGPIAGPIAYSAMMAILMGLLNFAIGKIGSGGKSKNTSSANTKLVTGMLTYDSGNVQDLKPFVADNGEVYWAKEDDGKQMQGVKMLTTPTATSVNGQPSLVAEKGPEIVIGRETTHAMMMNNPGLLKALVSYDQNYSGRNSARRAFDSGNVGDVFAAGTQGSNGNLSSGASAADGLLAASAASNAALLQAVNALIQRLNQPINAQINMYGRDGLHDSLNKANQFMKGK